MPFLSPNQQRESTEGTKVEKSGKQKKKRKTDMLRSIGKQSGESV